MPKPPPTAPPTIGDIALRKGLPSNPEAERLVIGSILLDSSRYPDIAQTIKPEYFSLEKNRRIFARMQAMADAGIEIDRITLANELDRFNELQAVDGLSYLASLDEGLPRLPRLDGYVKIILDKYRLRQCVIVGEKLARQAISQEFTPDELVQVAQTAITEGIGGYGGSQIERLDTYIANYPGGANVMLDASKRPPGILLGFEELDDWTNGIRPSEIFVFGARPGIGKTSWLLNVAKNMARSGAPGAIFSMEMSKESLLDRMICEEAFISVSRFRKGRLTDEERRRLMGAANEINALPLYIEDSSGLTVADMRVKLLQVLRENPLMWFSVDYAQLIRGRRGKRYNSENDKFTDVGDDIQELVKSMKLGLILLSQLNRESEKSSGDNKPRLSQTRGSGKWEEIANVGACIHREYLRKREREDLRDVAELIVEKNRSGPSGIVRLRYVDWLMRFEDPPSRGRTETRDQSADA